MHGVRRIQALHGGNERGRQAVAALRYPVGRPPGWGAEMTACAGREGVRNGHALREAWPRWQEGRTREGVRGSPPMQAGYEALRVLIGAGWQLDEAVGAR
jgi:hypothetical protein